MRRPADENMTTRNVSPLAEGDKGYSDGAVAV